MRILTFSLDCNSAKRYNLCLFQHQPELPAVCVAGANLLHPQFHLHAEPVFHAITFHRILIESYHIWAIICSLVFDAEDVL